MIKFFRLDQIDSCINLIHYTNKNSMKVRYFPTTNIDIIERLNKRNNQEDVSILLCEAEGVNIGYMELLVDSKEKYLQILAFFTNGQFDSVLDEYFEYIERSYPSYKLHYVVSDFNSESIKYMERIGAGSDGIEVMVHVNKEECNLRTNSKVSEMQKEHHLEFIKLHDEVYSEAYWTGELILEDETRFNKHVIIQDNKLVGYSITSNLKRSEEEIYFVYSNDIECKLDLISESLKYAFESADTVQLLLEESEKSEILNLKSLGFTEKESIITYLVESI